MDQIRDLENMIENLRKNFANVSKLDERISDLANQIVIIIIPFKRDFCFMIILLRANILSRD